MGIIRLLAHRHELRLAVEHAEPVRHARDQGALALLGLFVLPRLARQRRHHLVDAHGQNAELVVLRPGDRRALAVQMMLADLLDLTRQAAERVQQNARLEPEHGQHKHDADTGDKAGQPAQRDARDRREGAGQPDCDRRDRVAENVGDGNLGFERVAAQMPVSAGGVCQHLLDAPRASAVRPPRLPAGAGAHQRDLQARGRLADPLQEKRALNVRAEHQQAPGIALRVRQRRQRVKDRLPAADQNARQQGVAPPERLVQRRSRRQIRLQVGGCHRAERRLRETGIPPDQPSVVREQYRHVDCGPVRLHPELLPQQPVGQRRLGLRKTRGLICRQPLEPVQFVEDHPLDVAADAPDVLLGLPDHLDQDVTPAEINRQQQAQQHQPGEQAVAASDAVKRRNYRSVWHKRPTVR